MRAETRYPDEAQRWEIHHSQESIKAEGNPAGDATFIRISQHQEHRCSTYLTLFQESDAPGVPRLAMNLWPEQLDELIADLQEARASHDAIEGGCSDE